MHFHAVLFGNQHEIWSKQHNGKVSHLHFSTLSYMHLHVLSGAFSEDCVFVIGFDATMIAEKMTLSVDLTVCPCCVSYPLLLLVELPLPL